MSIRWQQIRAQAAAVRARYLAATGSSPIALPLEDLAERLFLLSAFDDPTLGAQIDGELNPQLGTVRLRPGMRPTRRRFVIAHELGHFVLEAGALALFEDDETTLDEAAGSEHEAEAGVLRAYNTRERGEREANLFALELLVPVDMVLNRVGQPGWTLTSLAQEFEVGLDTLRAQLVNVFCVEPPVEAPDVVQPARTFAPDPYQQAAIDAPLPTLVVAGPGTGKTRTIVAKYLSLVEEGVDPANILALTFSNKAAEELRDRIIAAIQAAKPPPEAASLTARVDVSTFHAWGLNFLRQFGQHLDLPLDARLRSSADLYVLLRQRLHDLPLEQYKNLREPGMYLRQIIGAMSRAKDALIEPAEFAQLADAEAERLLAVAEAEHAGKTTKTAQRERERAARNAARLRELAAVYKRYTALLRETGSLDYGDLIALAVEALRQPEIAEAARRQHQYILVDEFQDINDASGELLRLLDGGRGRLWAVGDPWQSIYRFRGASPANVRLFSQSYPGATIRNLRLNYRSRQLILDASHAIMASEAQAMQREALLAHRGLSQSTHVVEWLLDTAEAEAAAIAEDIQRRTRTAPRTIWGLQRGRKTSLRLKHTRQPLRRNNMPFRVAHFRDHAILCRTHVQAERIAAALRARNVPVDLAGELFADSNVQDALALCGMLTGDSAATLRALTLPGYALSADDIHLLARFAREHSMPLADAIRDTHATAQISSAGQHQLAALVGIGETLAVGDAWQALVGYTFERRSGAQNRLTEATNGDRSARLEFAALGQLLVLARSFVRQAPEGGRDASAFVGYVRALIEGGERQPISMPAEHTDAVRVLTVHAAKGLEFPVVYVPGLLEGVFPPRRQYGSIPPLPGLTPADEGDELAEERYLLYVAMTRAQDMLVLSRAATTRNKPTKRSPLLPGGEDNMNAPWVVRRPRVRQPHAGEAVVSRLHAPAIEHEPVPAAALETYERCPRQYFYRYGFALDEKRAPFLRAQQATYKLLDMLQQQAEAGALPEAHQLPALVDQVFREDGLDQVLYRDDYAAEALARLQQAWQELQTSKPRQPIRCVVRMPSGHISVPIDRIEQGERGPRFVRSRSGPPREDDHLSTRVALYGLAQQQEHGGEGEVVLSYPESGAERVVAHKPAALHERAKTIDMLLQRIRQHDYSPSPGPQCATCPFNLICPV